MTTDTDKDELIRALEAKVQDLEYRLDADGVREMAGELAYMRTKASDAEGALVFAQQSNDLLRKMNAVLIDDTAKLRADRDRLAGEVDDLLDRIHTMAQRYGSAVAEHERLTAELAAARENEARYLALVGSGAYVPSQMNKQCPWGLGAGYGRPATKAELDAAIDAARRAGGE